MVFFVAVVAVVLVAVRPRRVPAWVWPVAGAALLVLLRAESPAAALRAIAAQWNVLLFILGLMGLSIAAERSGAFAWLTELLLVRAGGSRRRLFAWLFGAGTVTTLLLSNDATAIVLTPIVYAAVARRGGDPMPYLYACAFVANAASFGLPFSNPANVLIVPQPHLLGYVRALGVPELCALGVTFVAFLLVFRRSLDGRYDCGELTAPGARTLRTLVAMGTVGALYFVALAIRFPLGPTAVAGACITLLGAGVAPAVTVRRISWNTFALLAGLFVLLDAVAHAGFVDWALAQLHDAARFSALAVVALTAVGAAGFSNLLNNLPVAVAASYVAAHDPSQYVAYPAIVGVDLGPNLTTAGSLATLLWLSVLNQRGLRVSPLEYLRLGILVVPPSLVAAALWLWAMR